MTAAMSSLKKQSQKAKEELTNQKNAEKENWSKYEKANEDREFAAQELVKSMEKKYKELEPENTKLKAQVESLNKQLKQVESAKTKDKTMMEKSIASKNEEIIKLKSQLELFTKKVQDVSMDLNKSITEMTKVKEEYYEDNKEETKQVVKKRKLTMPVAKKMKLSDALQKISAGDVNGNLSSDFDSDSSGFH